MYENVYGKPPPRFGENAVTLPLDVDRPCLHKHCSLHTTVYGRWSSLFLPSFTSSHFDYINYYSWWFLGIRSKNIGWQS